VPVQVNKQFGLSVGLALNTSGNCYPASLNNFHYSRVHLGFVLALAEAGYTISPCLFCFVPASVPQLAELEGALSLYQNGFVSGGFHIPVSP